MEPASRVENGFRKSLNQHGYSFQYAVWEFLCDAARRHVPWIPVTPEFAVEVRGRDTRIDLILEHRMQKMYMICECKRANPATANWCFAPAPWPEMPRHASMTKIPTVRRTLHGGCMMSLRDLLHSDRAFQVALEVRTGERGHEKGAGRGEIEDAATQVCRGVNGFIEFLKQREDFLPKEESASLVPVVFTTAKLWTSPVSIGNADVRTGDLGVADLRLEEIEWLWFDYPQSHGMQHSVGHYLQTPSLTDVFYAETVRRIAIVNVGGIENFVRSQLWGP